MYSINRIFNLNFSDLEKLFESWGEPPFRAVQVWEGLYKQLWTAPEEFTNLPKLLRQKLETEFSVSNREPGNIPDFSSFVPRKIMHSADGETTKAAFSLEDNRQVEAVLMNYSKRNTLCISTQSGCAMGCVFCATGQMGFTRNLTSGEIVEQVLYYARNLKQSHQLVTNIVVMGMGEPFHNYDATMSAIKRLNDPLGFNLGTRRFTISTVGLVPGIHRFTQERSQVNLAISLHAADDDLRTRLLPINKKYPLDILFAACREYVDITRRRLSFEWALINGINDTPSQAKMLIQRLKPFQRAGSALCHVNLIQLNPTKLYEGQASTINNARQFQSLLEQSGIPCTIRLRRGIEIQAGCGQLAEIVQ